MHQINKGDEITVHYFPFPFKISLTEERHTFFIEKWNFCCSCDLCNFHDESDEKMEELMKLKKRSQRLETKPMKSLQIIKDKIDCYKKYYALMIELRQESSVIVDVVL